MQIDFVELCSGLWIMNKKQRTTNKEQRTKNKEQRTTNKEQRTPKANTEQQTKNNLNPESPAAPGN